MGSVVCESEKLRTQDLRNRACGPRRVGEVVLEVGARIDIG